MRAAALLLVFAASLLGWNPQEDVNVNSRYTVESVNVTAPFVSRINHDLRQELDSVVGKKLDNSLLERLAGRMRRELRVQNVTVRVHRGQMADHVKVEFEIQSGRRHDFDVEIPKVAYHSKQGWTGAGQATTTIGNTAMTFGVVSDGDELIERFSGVRARVERLAVGSRRVQVKFEYDNYHDQWSDSTVAAVARDPGAANLYQTRQVMAPGVTVALTPELRWSVGAELDRLDPESPAARSESANSVTSTLRFHRQWEDQPAVRQEMDASYTIRSAGRALGSDYSYTRQTARVRYEWALERNTLTLDFTTGGVIGRAPLYERLVLGNASTLRGWNKYDLDPLGGDRVVHGSVDYRYRFLTVFYDTGVVWNGPSSSGQKHAAGCGFRAEGKEGFLLAVAFPLKSGHMDPMFIVGFNF
jgi:hypothetical protein